MESEENKKSEENDDNDFFKNLLKFNKKLESIEKLRAYNKNKYKTNPIYKQKSVDYYHRNKNNPEFRQRRLLADKAYRERKRQTREYKRNYYKNKLSNATLNIPLEEEILSINTKIPTPPQQATEPPQQPFLMPPQQSVLMPPQQSVLMPPQQSVLMPPQQSVLMPPQQSFLMPPHQQSFLPPPQQPFLMPPQQPFLMPPQQPFLMPPQQSFLMPPQQPMFFLQPQQTPLVNTSTFNSFTNSNDKSKRLAAAIAATRAARGLPPYKGGKTKRLLRGNKCKGV